MRDGSVTISFCTGPSLAETAEPLSPESRAANQEALLHYMEGFCPRCEVALSTEDVWQWGCQREDHDHPPHLARCPCCRAAFFLSRRHGEPTLGQAIRFEDIGADGWPCCAHDWKAA